MNPWGTGFQPVKHTGTYCKGLRGRLGDMISAGRRGCGIALPVVAWALVEGKEIKQLIRREPFEPIEIGLSDGRTIVVQHPDQVIVARRHVIFGLAQVRRAQGRVSTPTDGDAVAKDWMLVDLIHVVSVEPMNGEPGTQKRRKPRPRRR